MMCRSLKSSGKRRRGCAGHLEELVKSAAVVLRKMLDSQSMLQRREDKQNCNKSYLFIVEPRVKVYKDKKNHTVIVMLP